MAKLDFYRQRTIPQGAGNAADFGPAYRSVARNERITDQLISAGTSLHLQRQAEIERRREDEAAIDASARVTEMRRRWIERERTLQTEAQERETFDGFAGRLTEEYDREAAEAVEAAKTPSAKAWMQGRLGDLGTSLFDRGMAWEASAKVERDVRLVGRSLDSARVTVDSAPDQYEGARSDLMLQYSRLPAEQRAKLWEDADQTLAYSAGLGAARSNPYRIVRALDAAPGTAGVAYIDNLGANGRLQLRSVAETEIRRREAEARARQAESADLLAQRYRDQVAMIMDGVPVADPLTLPDFVGAYGAEDGPDKYRGYQEIVRAGGDFAALVSMPAGEMPEFLQGRQAQASASEEGYAGRSKLQDQLAQRAAQVVKARETDPGAWLYQYTPTVKAAYEALGAAQTPEDAKAAADRYARAASAESARLGIDNPALLPKAYADAKVAEFYQQEEGGEPAALGIMTERERWGRHWPRVFAQLAPDLPGTAFVIGTGMAPGPAGRLAEFGALKEADLGALLPSGVAQSDVKSAVGDALADMSASVSGQPGDARLMGMLNDAAYRLAVGYIAAGRSAADAADQAAADVVNDRYAFVDFDDAILRVPLAVSVSDARRGLRTLDNRVRRELGYARIDEAAWRTLPNDAGVVLMHGSAPVLDRAGAPVTYTWDDLRNQAATTRQDVIEAEREVRRMVPLP